MVYFTCNDGLTLEKLPVKQKSKAEAVAIYRDFFITNFLLSATVKEF